MVVWLDPLEHYLDHADRLPPRLIRELVNAGLLVLATHASVELGRPDTVTSVLVVRPIAS